MNKYDRLPIHDRIKLLLLQLSFVNVSIQKAIYKKLLMLTFVML